MASSECTNTKARGTGILPHLGLQFTFVNEDQPHQAGLAPIFDRVWQFKPV